MLIDIMDTTRNREEYVVFTTFFQYFVNPKSPPFTCVFPPQHRKDKSYVINQLCTQLSSTGAPAVLPDMPRFCFFPCTVASLSDYLLRGFWWIIIHTYYIIHYYIIELLQESILHCDFSSLFRKLMVKFKAQIFSLNQASGKIMGTPHPSGSKTFLFSRPRGFYLTLFPCANEFTGRYRVPNTSLLSVKLKQQILSFTTSCVCLQTHQLKCVCL